MSNLSLFRVDSITVDGAPLAIEDGSATMTGAASYEATAVPSATGPDFESYRRVPRMINAKLQFGPGVNPDELRKIRDARIVLKDINGPRRVLCTRCGFASMGAIGSGAVDIAFNVLDAPQWL